MKQAGTAAILGGVALIATVGAGVAEGFLPYENTGAVARGQAIYDENCASCHGANLEGEDNWRDRGADGLMPAPPHDESGHTWHHPDQVLFAITKYGTAKVVGQGYESNMPGFEDVLSDEQILEVLAYIKSTWPARVIDMHNARNGG